MNQDEIQDQKCTNLDFLKQLTKGNPKMISEMITVYLEETPRLISKLKEGIEKTDWDLIGRTAHSLIPSFSTMGMHKYFSVMAKKIQELAEKKEGIELAKEYFLKIEAIFSQARKELEQDLVELNKA